MRKPRSVNNFLFYDYNVKAEYLYNSCELNRYLDFLINRLGIIKNIKTICSNSMSSCLSRYIALRDYLNKGTTDNSNNVKCDFKSKFNEDMMKRVAYHGVSELKFIAKDKFNINLDKCDIRIEGYNAVITDENGREYNISLVEGKLFSKNYTMILGEESKIEVYLDWIGEFIEYEKKNTSKILKERG